MIVTAGADAVSMEAVADQAGVSRALLYKHFTNRGGLLAAVYRREAVLLHADLASHVRAATSVEGMYQALVRAALQAAEQRSAVFLALRAAGVWNRELRQEQREREQATVTFFARRASEEFGLAVEQARAVSSMLLAAIDPILHQWRHDPSPEHAGLLEDTYLALVRGGMTALRAGPGP